MILLLFLIYRHPLIRPVRQFSPRPQGHCLLHPRRQNCGADFSGEFYLHLAADIFRRRLSGHLPGVDTFDPILFILWQRHMGDAVAVRSIIDDVGLLAHMAAVILILDLPGQFIHL